MAAHDEQTALLARRWDEVAGAYEEYFVPRFRPWVTSAGATIRRDEITPHAGVADAEAVPVDVPLPYALRGDVVAIPAPGRGRRHTGTGST